MSLLAAVGLLLAVNVGLAVLVAALRLRNERIWIRRRALRDEWHPLILGLIAGDEQTVDLRERVDPDDPSEVVEVVAEFARRLTGSDRDRLLEFVAPFLGSVAGDLHSTHAEARARVIRLLGELAFPTHRDEIVAALDDPSPLVSMMAATALSGARAIDDAGSLMAQIDRFSGWSPGYLASLVSGMGPAVAEDARVLLIDRGNGARTRDVAARTLALLRDGASADVAAGLLESEEDEEVLNACLRLLRAVGSARHAPAVRPLLGHAAFSVRAHACAVLGRTGSEADIERLVPAIFDESPWVAIHAAGAILRLGGTGVLEEIGRSSNERATVAAEAIAGVAS